MRTYCSRSNKGCSTGFAINAVRALLMMMAIALSPVYADEPVQTAERSRSAQEAAFQHAQAILDSGSASVAALEKMRAQLVQFRDAASVIVDRGSVDARAIQAQIDSLGPPPGENETEPEDIASRRLELNNALAKANEPVRAARESLERAALLIRETDSMIRSQDTQELMKRLPTPLMPQHWVTATEDLSVYLKRLQREVEASLNSPAKSAHLQAVIHEVWMLLIVGLAVLLFIQPRIIARLERAALASRTRLRRWTFAILLNLMRLVLPGAAALALIQIVPVVDLTPFSARTLAQLLPFLALFLVVAHWLGHTLFAPSAPASRLLPFDDKTARWGVRLSWGLGLVVVAELALEAITRDYTFRPSTISVLSTPLIFIASILLWRLAALLRQQRTVNGTQPDTEPPQADSGFLMLISTLMRLSALVAPVLILLGFVNLSRHIAVPLILTMVELGVALFLYQLCIIVLHALNGRDTTAEEDALSLLPIIVIFFLVLLFTPLLALTWGAHTTDIAEVWHLLTNGVQFGDIRLSLDVVLTLIVVFTVGTVLTRWMQRLLRVSVLPRTRLDSGARTALVTGIGYIGITLAALIAVSTAGLDLSSLAFVAGALTVGIGFGLQTIVSNFVSGIILLIERPIKEGDWIEVSGYTGFVRKIAVRSTRIETFDGHDVIVPNSDLIAGTVTNMTLSSKSGRLILPVGVAYGSDLEKTKSILLEAARGHASLKNYPPPNVLFIGLGDSSLDFELRCFLHDVGELVTTKSDLLFTIYVELNRAGIEIPFPQRDLHLRDIDRLVTAIEGRAAVSAPTAAS